MGHCCSGTTMDSMNYQSDWPIQQWLLYGPIIAHVMNSNPDTQLGTQNKKCRSSDMQTNLMHGSNFSCYHPLPPTSQQPPGQVQPFGPKWSCPRGRGGGGWGSVGNKNISFLWFCEVLVISRAVYTMAADLKTTFRKQEFVRQWLERNNFSKFKSVFKGMF